MRKIIITLLLLNTVYILKAQRLETKIPSSADVVVSANAENLFELISVADIDASFVGKEMLRGINRKREEKLKSVSEVGFNIKSNAYYFFENTDSIGYHNFFLELNDIEKFKSLLSKRDLSKVKTEKGLSYIQSYKGIRIWNSNSLLIVNGEKSERKFKSKKVKERVKEYAINLFNNKNGLTLASNRAFQKAKKDDSSATVWISSYGNLLSGVMKTMNSMAGIGALSSLLEMPKDKNIYGIEEVVANLFFEKDNVNMVVDMTVSSGVKKSFKKMYDRKMSKNILNNFDHKNILAFASLSMNTEEVLLEYPYLINELYGNALPKFKEELSLITDLFSLVLDEEAVGDLITGNALFVLNDFSKQEVEYVTYEFDDDYKRKEIVKKKEEIIPDFTLMIGSKKEKLLKKVLNLGLKHGALTKEGSVLALKGELPFKIYVVVKDGVMHLTTLKERAGQVLSAKKSYDSSDHSKLIKKSSTLMYVDIHKLMGKAPEGMFRRKEKKAFDFGYENLKDAYLKVSKMKGNKISTQLKLNTMTKEENSLKLLFSFIKTVAGK